MTENGGKWQNMTENDGKRQGGTWGVGLGGTFQLSIAYHSSSTSTVVDSDLSGSVEFRKCQGHRFMAVHLADMYVKFPFSLVPSSDFVFENGTIHQSRCVKEDYRSLLPWDEKPRCNKVCFDLHFTHAVKKIVSYMEDNDLHKSTINNQYLSHHQLELSLKECQKKVSKQRLVILTQSKVILRLNKTLLFHERFMHFIATHRIHRLHDTKTTTI